MDASMLLYWETYDKYFSSEQIVHKSFNPLRDYEEEFIEGPILDIGCGQSNFLIEYSLSKRDIYAVDNERYQLEKLKKRILGYSSGNVGKLNFLEITLPNGKLPNETFALIVLSNILHFFDISDCQKIIEQLKERTSKGSLIYVLVHSARHYKNEPEDENNNEYFKHYFFQEDLDKLFDSKYFDRVYSADIQREYSKLDKLVIDKWIDKSLDRDRITNAKKRASIKADYLNGLSESNIASIFRRT